MNEPETRRGGRGLSLAKLERAGKEYGSGVRTRALYPTDLELRGGELVVLLGPSGSGKTTLLNLLGGLDQPSEGKVSVQDLDLTALSPSALTKYRRETVGFVFQFFNLVPSLTALENVLVAAELTGGTAEDAGGWLQRVGLQGKEDRFPSELSGGEQQRVAIARALSKKPRLLLADEPTGALDHESGSNVLQLLKQATNERHCGVVIVTHDESVAQLADRVIRIRDGKVVSDERGDARTPRAET